VARGNRGRWVALDYVVTRRDIERAYDCIRDEMTRLYGKSGLPVAAAYHGLQRVNRHSFYAPANDFGWANLFVNAPAKRYGANEFTGVFAPGSTIVKESFVFDVDGSVGVGPLFYMIKMQPGFNAESGDWKFVEADLDDHVAETKGVNGEATARCIVCHGKRRTQDCLFFIKPHPKFAKMPEK
tara:strand:- start:180 stop:728 length:549 start_codon:yes stop_codon:yes gene_type:complete